MRMKWRINEVDGRLGVGPLVSSLPSISRNYDELWAYRDRRRRESSSARCARLIHSDGNTQLTSFSQLQSRLQAPAFVAAPRPLSSCAQQATASTPHPHCAAPS